MKKFLEIELSEQAKLKANIIALAKQFTHSSVLMSNQYDDQYGQYEFMAAIDSERTLKSNGNSFEQLKQFYDNSPSWLFGHFSYDLKNQLENLESRHSKKFDFPELSFFEPKYLFLQKRESTHLEIWLNSSAEQTVIEDLLKDNSNESSTITQLPTLQPKQSQKEYLKAIRTLKDEIQFGNIYEINYCTEFYSENCDIEPIGVFHALNKKSPMPFGAWYKQGEDYLLCASPERFMNKRGDSIISQPIKGTAKRGKDKDEDMRIKQQLKTDLKEQTENVMIVDIVRNDLSKTASKKSVEVKELMGVYSFPQVHQLISTVGCELSPQHHFIDAIREAFPMGSMTGAPKISAMKLADQYECSRRELYSGSIGYIKPNGDFDFNVVIRSLLYSAEKKYLSLTVGGAITILSDAEEEYNECLLKAKAIFDLNKVD